MNEIVLVRNSNDWSLYLDDEDLACGDLDDLLETAKELGEKMETLTATQFAEYMKENWTIR